MGSARAALLFTLIALLSCGAGSHHAMSTYAGVDTWDDVYTLPDDTAPPTAAQVNPALEALGDRTRYLYNRVNIAAHVLVTFKHSVDTAVSSSLSTSGYAAVSMSGIQTGGGIMFDCPGLLVGDVVEVDFSCSLGFTINPSGDDNALLKLQDSQNGGGAADMPGSIQEIQTSPSASSNANDLAVRCRGIRTITSAGDYQVQLLGQTTAGSTGVLLAGSASATVKVYRPTPGL